jgi:small subunit ribosomal protein S16
MFRVVVQDARVTPTSGKVVAFLGSFDPHSKAVTLDKEKAAVFLSNGAQPSDRAAKLLESEGVKLPKWYKKPAKKTAAIKNADKLRRNQPKEEVTEAAAEEPAESTEAAVEEAAPEVETPAEEAPAEAEKAE